MVDFRDPARVALDLLAVEKLWHLVYGLYIWEFASTLGYEWSVFRGHRQYLKTIWLYSLTRVAMLFFVTLNMLGFDSTRPINCQDWVIAELTFCYISVAGATLLIAIRTIAVWDKNKIVVTIIMCTWLTEVAFLIHSIATYTSYWSPELRICTTPNTAVGSRYNVLVTLSTDVILLLIMLLGLYRRGCHGGRSHLARLLWTQGVVWLLLAAVAEVPPTVFVFLNLNDAFNLMFQAPALVTVVIAATRMYRSLTNFGSSNISQDRPASRRVPVTNGSSAEPIPLKRVEVAVHTRPEDCAESWLRASQYGLYLNKDGQLYGKPQEHGTDGDLESGEHAEEK